MKEFIKRKRDKKTKKIENKNYIKMTESLY